MNEQIWLLIKEIRRISLWLIMSFWRENHRDKRRMLIYTKTLGVSDWFEDVLAKKSQSRWWVILTRISPSQFEALGIVRMVDHGGSWMKIISNCDWVLRIVLMISKFFRTFWEKTFMLSRIIAEDCCSWLNESIWICFHGSQCISSGTNLCWTYASRKDISLNLLGIHPNSWNIWKCVNMVYLFFFLGIGDLSLC